MSLRLSCWLCNALSILRIHLFPVCPFNRTQLCHISHFPYCSLPIVSLFCRCLLSSHFFFPFCQVKINRKLGSLSEFCSISSCCYIAGCLPSPVFDVFIRLSASASSSPGAKLQGNKQMLV